MVGSGPWPARARDCRTGADPSPPPDPARALALLRTAPCPNHAPARHGPHAPVFPDPASKLRQPPPARPPGPDPSSASRILCCLQARPGQPWGWPDVRLLAGGHTDPHPHPRRAPPPHAAPRLWTSQGSGTRSSAGRAVTARRARASPRPTDPSSAAGAGGRAIVSRPLALSHARARSGPLGYLPTLQKRERHSPPSRPLALSRPASGRTARQPVSHVTITRRAPLPISPTFRGRPDTATPHVPRHPPTRPGALRTRGAPRPTHGCPHMHPHTIPELLTTRASQPELGDQGTPYIPRTVSTLNPIFKPPTS